MFLMDTVDDKRSALRNVTFKSVSQLRSEFDFIGQNHDGIIFKPGKLAGGGIGKFG